MTPPPVEPELSRDPITSINDSTAQINTITLAFIAACTYIAISVASVTPEILFFGSTIGLPLLDVKVPLEHFFVLAPLLLGLLHLHLLLQQYLLAVKIDATKELTEAELERYLLPALSVSVLRRPAYAPVVRRLLNFLFAAINMAVPIILLCFIQVKFVPYHSAWTTAWHELLILSDLFLVWYFFVSTPNEAASLRTWTPVGLVVLTVGALAVSAFLAQGPGSGWEFRAGATPLLQHLIPRNLVLGESTWPASDSPPRISADEASSPRRGRQLDFHERDLRGADLTAAVLPGADFRGANLDGAVLDDADLRGAEFTPFKAPVTLMDAPLGAEKREKLAELSRHPVEEATSLRAVRLHGAKLQRARLLYADLRAADLGGAHLEEAELSFADLRGAILTEVAAERADFTHSRLDLAELRMAKLSGASLAGASLVGVDLREATLYAVDLSGADLRGIHAAKLAGSGSVFSEAKLVGADLRDAELVWTIGVVVEAVRLRGAGVGGADWCGAGTPLPYRSDLRDLRAGYYGAGYRLLVIEKSFTGGILPQDVHQRLEGRPETACIARPDGSSSIAGTEVLYDAPERAKPLRAWPEPKNGTAEAAFLRTLARHISDELCDNSGARSLYAEAVVKEVAGRYTPRDPLLEAEIARNLGKRIQDPLDQCSAIRKLSPAERELIAHAAHEDLFNPSAADEARQP